MAINRINETDLQGKLVSQLSNRPTDPRSAGGDNMTAQEVKARHDALGLLVKDKLNELLDALNNATVNGEPVTPLSDLITVVVDGVSKSLTAWIEDKYSLPLTGIPKDDLSDGVKASLDLADSAYQLPETGIPADALASAVKTILNDALLESDADMSAIGGKLGRRDYSGVLHGATYGASAIGTALVNKEQFEPVKALALGATKAFSVENYAALVTALSSAEKTAYRVGQTIFVGTAEVPDVWIYSVEDSSVSYTYTTDSTLEASLVAGTLQIGYFTLRQMETKTDLSDYATTDAVSEAIDALIDALVDGVVAVAEATYAESATYAQQADFANQINTDREIEDADTACPPVVFGTVGGNAEVQSGLNKFSELRGHTIKWNQLVQNGNFDGTTRWSGNTATISASDNVLTAVQTDVANYFGIITAISSIPTNHKILVSFEAKADEETNIRIRYPASVSPQSLTTSFKRFGFFANSGSTGFPNDGQLYLQVYNTSSINTAYFKNVQLFDLTDIYGAGNEPSTLAEFVRDFFLPFYGYSVRTPLSSKSSSVDFVKRNQCPALDTFFNVLPNTEYEVSGITAGGYLQEFDGNKTLIKTSSEITSTTDITLTAQTVYAKIQATTYTDVLCYIKWETPNQPYVPYSKQTITLPNIELRSVGDVYDVAYQTGGGKRRIGERAYQSGDENDPDVMTDGTTTLYVLETETDITLEENPGWTEYAEIDNFGTVKFNQDPAQTIPVPQAYFVRYTVNLVEFLDSLYVHCGGDVTKLALVEQLQASASE